MRKLLARLALGAALALLVGFTGAASALDFDSRRAIDIQFMAYEEDEGPTGVCYYECTVEVTHSEEIMDGDGRWSRVSSVSYDGEGTSKPGNANPAECELPENMPPLTECPSGR